MSLFVCSQQFSFLSSLGHCECCWSAFLWGWGCGHIFHDLLVSQMLWDWNHHTISCVSFCDSRAFWQSYPSMLWLLIYHQWHIRDALLILPYSFCRVLYNGLFGFSLVLLHCSLIFHITDYEANEAHFQRLLSKHWMAFTCWSFLPYLVVCSCFYFSVLLLAIL